MKHSTPYLLLAALCVLILSLFVLSPSKYNQAAALGEVLITATLASSFTPPADDAGEYYADASHDDSNPLVVAQVIALPTATRTPTPINAGNFVWDDKDGDGVQDTGEPGMAGITVQLWNAAKNDLIDSATTNTNGNYTLIAPLPGDYRVRVLLPNPNLDQFSPKDAGADTTDSDINPSGADFGFTDIYTFAPNLISTTNIDAGIIRYVTPTPTRTPTPINIGNFVWDDIDNDGVQESGEPGIAGVTVQLWNAAKNDLIDSATTNTNGNYTVIAPMAGDYRIRVLLPNPSFDQFSPKDVGMDTTDSDINPTGMDAGFTDAFNIASNVISITTKDAGIKRFPTPTPTNTPTATYTPTATPTISAPLAAPLRDFYSTPIVHLSWTGVSWATGYAIEVDDSSTFGSPAYANYSLGANADGSFVFLPLFNSVYYWRVGAKRADGTILWGAAQTFTVDLP